jgi:DNA-binding transcriptional LysR family regulator
LHQACLGGLGITKLPECDVEAEAAVALLPVPLCPWQPEAVSIWSVYPTARPVPPKVQFFIAALEARLDQAGDRG